MNGLRYVTILPRTQKTRHNNIDAAAKTDQNAGEQRYQNGRGAHGTQRMGAGKLPDHGNVRHVEKNLQNVRGHQRQTEQQHVLGQRAFGHGGIDAVLLLHMCTPL